MTLPQLLKDFAVYNHWANRKMVDWLSAHDDELLFRTTPSSFPSLAQTLLHIWDAQYVWFQRIQGLPLHEMPSRHFNGLASDAYEGLLRSSEKFVQLLTDREDAFFEENIEYPNLKGSLFTNAAAEIILHAMQHSTYHRGQLVTMGRCLGLSDPPQTDYIHYLRQ